MTIRAFVVDDETVARQRIIRLLSARKDVELVGQAGGGRAAVEAIRRLQPDLVFLDVQMPDLDAFAVLSQLDAEKLPAIIFVTAYDQYALRAFEACAIDYLLKPYETDRFFQALDRALRWLSAGTVPLDEVRLRELLREVLRDEQQPTNPPPPRLDRFMIKRDGRTQFIRASEVDWIEAEGNYIRLHVGHTSHLVRGTVTACAQALDPGKFVQVHRRHVVNMDRVKEVQPWFGGDHVIVLETGCKIRLSRNYRDRFQKRMMGD